MQSDDNDIEISKQIFSKHWIDQTAHLEEINGIATIDFTYEIVPPIGMFCTFTSF